MKILWIVNLPFGPLMEMAGLKGDNASGSWLNAALLEFMGIPDVEVCVATTWKTPKFLYEVHGNMSYCLLPGNAPFKYDVRSSNNEQAWKTLQERFKPDIIHIWGTEYPHGYHAMQVMRSVPSIIYIQGLLDAVTRYYTSGLSRKEQFACRGLRDLLTVNPVEKARRRFELGAMLERRMIQQSQNVIVENNWCASHCAALADKCQIFKSKLPIRQEFFHANWDSERMRPHSIMCNTSGYPVKGLHMLIKAMHLIVKQYPAAVLKIPGDSFLRGGSIWGRLRRTGYSRLIRRLIDTYGLRNNVKFLGCVPTSDLFAQEMATANVFVMPSSIENHSSTLIEAMIVGVPCVVSDVGGTSELIVHGMTGFLYRFEEYELLAYYVCTLLGDRALAQRMGFAGKTEMRKQRVSASLKDEFMAFYRQVLAKASGEIA